MSVSVACGFLWGCEDEPTSPKDTTPPAAVADLLTVGTTQSSIILTWTAPGDDGRVGRAALYDIRQLNGPITEGNWNQAQLVDAVVAYPKAAGEAETLLVRNLVPGQDYFFALRAADESANWSALSNVALSATLDDTPPATVADLAVDAFTDSSVTLSWTAPGDDGQVGQAASYDIRYAFTSITEATWPTALPVDNPPNPSGGGFAETFEITPLDPLRTYFFALRAEDDSHNLSGLSNVVQATTSFTLQDPGDLVDKLALAYSRRDGAIFTTLFPSSDPAYLFFLYEPLSGGQTNWDVVEELRIHRRMFYPEIPQPGETPLPPELWLQSLVITLTPLSNWEERPDLYQSPGNPSGLDPARWRATEAQYHAIVFWDTQVPTDFRVDGQQSFVVIEDLNLAVGEEGKFLLYRWEDLGSSFQVTAVARMTWSELKSLYR